MNTSMPRILPPLLVLGLLANGCSAAQFDNGVSQAGAYFERAARGVSSAFTRAAGAASIHPRPETMYARANVNVRSGPGIAYDAIGAVAAGESVPVVQEKDGWYWIRHGRGHGWVNATYFLAGTPAGVAQVASASKRREPKTQVSSQPQFVQVVPHATEGRILAAERPAYANRDVSPSGAMTEARSQPITSFGDEVDSEPRGDAIARNAPATTVARLEAETPGTGHESSSLSPEPQADETDALEGDPAGMPGDASASAATPVASTEGDEASQLATAAALGGNVEVAGITFQWGMSPTATAARYGDRARRVEPNGAVWLRAASVGSGVDVPVEWFDLRYCARRLCAIHHVINDVAGEQKIGDEVAMTFAGQHGNPTADFWTDFGYGRLRMRTWRTPSTRVRLSHQEAQTYVAIDYEPIGVSRPPLRDSGQIGDQANTTTAPR